MPKISRKIKAIVTESMRRIIIEKSEEIIVREGLESLTMEKLACEAEISTGSIYNYFQNKEAIIHGIMESGFLRLLQNVQQIAAVEGSAVEKLRQLAVFMFDDFSRIRRLHEVIMLHHPPIPREKIREGHRQLVEAVANIILEGINANIFIQVDVYLAASSFLGIVRELQFDPGEMFVDVSPEELANSVLSIYLSGITNRE